MPGRRDGGSARAAGNPARVHRAGDELRHLTQATRPPRTPRVNGEIEASAVAGVRACVPRASNRSAERTSLRGEQTPQIELQAGKQRGDELRRRALAALEALAAPTLDEARRFDDPVLLHATGRVDQTLGHPIMDAILGEYFDAQFGNSLERPALAARDPAEEHEYVGLQDEPRPKANVEGCVADRDRPTLARRPGAQNHDQPADDFLVPVGWTGRHDDLPVEQLDLGGRLGEASKLRLRNHRPRRGAVHTGMLRTRAPIVNGEGAPFDWGRLRFPLRLDLMKVFTTKRTKEDHEERVVHRRERAWL